MAKSSNKNVRDGIWNVANSMSSAMYVLREPSTSTGKQYKVNSSGSFSSLEKTPTPTGKKK